MIKRFKVCGNSMEPYLLDGYQVIGEKLTYLFRKPKVGDVVIIRHPINKIPVIKRVTQKIGASYFVEGDNKKYSDDSRNFGLVSKNSILYKGIVLS